VRKRYLPSYSYLTYPPLSLPGLHLAHHRSATSVLNAGAVGGVRRKSSHTGSVGKEVAPADEKRYSFPEVAVVSELEER
jgi:hypothetical protein